MRSLTLPTHVCSSASLNYSSFYWPYWHFSFFLYFVLDVSNFSEQCEEIVNVIYVENSNQLRSILPRLDPLPRSSIFQRANDVYDKIIQSSQLSELKEVAQKLCFWFKLCLFKLGRSTTKCCNCSTLPCFIIIIIITVDLYSSPSRLPTQLWYVVKCSEHNSWNIWIFICYEYS